MAFTPSENPITNPTRESYTELRPFRFWCQKVLPLVYDDSLSYYELLCKVVDYLNKTMEDVDHMNTDMDTLYSNFQEFQEGTFRIYNELVDYVNTYFDELDVQEEINNKLDEMVTSGELVTILQPSIANEVAGWLAEHLTPTTPAIDDTLTVAGAGADAKTVGDIIKAPNHMSGFFASSSVIKYMGGSSNKIVSDSPIHVVIPLMHINVDVSTLENGKYTVNVNPYQAVLFNVRTNAITYSNNISNILNFSDYAVINYNNIESLGSYYNTVKLSQARTYDNVYIYSSAPIIKTANNTVHSDKAVVVLIRSLGIQKVFGSDSGGYTLISETTGDYLYYNVNSQTLFLSTDTNSSDENVVLVGVFNRYSLLEEITLSECAKPFLFSSNPIFHDVENNRLLSKSVLTVIVPSLHTAYTCAEDGTDNKGFKYYNIGSGIHLYLNTITNKLLTMTYQTTQSNTLLYLLCVSPYAYTNIEISNRPNIKNTYNKRAYCFGDSVTWYDGNAYTWGQYQGQIAVGYEHYMRGLLHMSVSNRGISGATMVQICNSIRNTNDFPSADYVLITGGANDERKGTPLGELQPRLSAFNTNTFYGALQSAIEYILRQKSMMKIILMTPIMGFIQPNGYDGGSGDGTVNKKWADAIIDVANYYSLPLCDWYYRSGLNYFNTATYYADPPFGDNNNLYILHPSYNGFERMSNMLLPVIENC